MPYFVISDSKIQYLIPIMGMLLGNTISGVSVGLSNVLEDLSAGRDKVEALLALGADRHEVGCRILIIYA